MRVPRALLLVLLLTFGASAFSQVTGLLQAQILVVDELQPKPVALADFAITAGNGTVLNVRTDTDGKISVDLPAGQYTLSYDPHAFEPGATLELRVWKNDRNDYTSIKIDPAEQQQVWDRFKDWAVLPARN